MRAADPAAPAPVVSVVVPVRDGARVIGDQLDALAAQDVDVPFEVVVGDNGSTDGTAAVVAAHPLGRRVRVRVVDASDRAGASHARNRAIAASSGPIICCTDADDRVAPGWVAAFAAALGPRADQAVVAAGLIDARPLSPERFAAVEHCSRLRPEGVTGVPWAYGSSMAFTRRAWEELGGFDEAYVVGGEEVEIYIRAHHAGIAHVFVPEAVSHFRTRPTRRSRFAQMRARGRGNRLLAHRYPVELSGSPTLPELSLTRTLVGAARLFRHERPGIALQVGLDQLAIHLGEVDADRQATDRPAATRERARS